MRDYAERYVNRCTAMHRARLQRIYNLDKCLAILVVDYLIRKRETHD